MIQLIKKTITISILLFLFLLVISCNKTEEQADPYKPFIVLKGNNPAWSELGSPYTDAGAEAFDIDANRDTVNITSSMQKSEDININSIGTYQVRFNVKDESGNEADEVIRTVYVNQFK